MEVLVEIAVVILRVVGEEAHILEQEALEAIHLVEMEWEQPTGNNNEIA